MERIELPLVAADGSLIIKLQVLDVPVGAFTVLAARQPGIASQRQEGAITCTRSRREIKLSPMNQKTINTSDSSWGCWHTSDDHSIVVIGSDGAFERINAAIPTAHRSIWLAGCLSVRCGCQRMRLPVHEVIIVKNATSAKIPIR